MAESDTVRIEVLSPSNRCKYKIILRFDEVSIFQSTIFDLENNSAISNKSEFVLMDEKELDSIICLLKKSSFFKGDLKKDAWNYKVSIDAVEKINVYEDVDSNLLVKLIDLFEKNSGAEIDYNCF